MNPVIPAVVEKHLDALQFYEDGKLILASSNLTGRYWNGSIFCFKDVENAPNIEKCYAGIDTESGIGDICCLKENKVVIGMDSGAVELYQLEESRLPHFDTLAHSIEHDDIVSSLSVNCSQSKLISAGYDKCIKVWNLDGFRSVATYRPVHAGIVWQVACSATDPEILVSCSQDGKILLLDLRLPKPATALVPVDSDFLPTALAWKPESDNQFAVGDNGGKIYIRDIRNPQANLSYIAHRRPVFRLAFCPSNPNWLASCADDTIILVADISKEIPSIEYSNESHSDFIRGLAWSTDNCLFTCGWDKQVFKHVVNGVDMDLASGSSACSNENGQVDSVL